MMKRHDSDGAIESEDFSSFAAVSPIEEAAAMWLARLTSGETSEEDRAEFARWRAADPAHEAALRTMRGLWLGVERALDQPQASPVRASATSRRRGRFRGWALAASLLLMIAVGLQMTANGVHDEATGSGQRRSVALKDGSTLMLSGDTALDIHFDDRQRGIDLAHGEALFDVVADASRPFVVNAGNATVRVVGTRFSVRRASGALQVIVEHGHVEVRAGDAVASLTADQRISFRDGALSAISVTDALRDLAWHQGRLIINDRRLDEIAQELRPHYAGRLLVLGDRLGARRFTAVVDLDHIDNWLDALAETQSIRVQRLGPLVVMY